MSNRCFNINDTILTHVLFLLPSLQQLLYWELNRRQSGSFWQSSRGSNSPVSSTQIFKIIFTYCTTSGKLIQFAYFWEICGGLWEIPGLLKILVSMCTKRCHTDVEMHCSDVHFSMRNYQLSYTAPCWTELNWPWVCWLKWVITCITLAMMLL